MLWVEETRFPFSQESGRGPAWSSASGFLRRLQSRCQPSEGSTGEGCSSKFIWLLARFSSLRAFGLRTSLPCWLLVWASLYGSWLHQIQQGRESVFKVEVTVLWNVIMEVTSCHVGHILLIRSKSLGPAHTQREGGYSTVWERELWGSLGAVLESAQPQGVFPTSLYLFLPTRCVIFPFRDSSY